ncbi:DMT family transporter [Paenalcaligenes hominis]|uniref:DMT family transporter n=1 Tax=Paenalcaligenes hominis TaxID=643674 RepID=UPI0035231D8F
MSTPQRPIVGIVLLILSTWALSSLDASGKWIMAAGLPLLVMCWARYVIHWFLVLAVVLPMRGTKVFKAHRPRDQILRGLIMLFATLSFFSALRYLPQAEATAINFLAPLLVLSVAPWLLKEPSRLSRWIAAGVGFLGVLLIIRPSSGLHPLGVMFGLITAIFFATQFIVTRRLAVEDAFTTLIWSGSVGTVLTSLLMPFILPEIWPIFTTFGPKEWAVLMATGVFGALGHLLQIQAYQRAPASALAPFVYTQIISAAGLGWLVWGQFPDALSWLGIAIVCGSGAVIGYIEWRQQQHARRAAATLE